MPTRSGTGRTQDFCFVGGYLGSQFIAAAPFVIILAVLVVLPFVLNPYLVFGIGADATALLKIHLGVPFWLGLSLGGLITAAIGILVERPALRLSGLYLAMATLAFARLVQWVLIH